MTHRIFVDLFLVNILFISVTGLFFDRICPNLFTCYEHRKIRCIDIKLVCDHKKDCLNGEDEEYCDQNICRENELLCLNGVCIPKYYHPMRCDGKKDCADGSDETGCSTNANIITVTQILTSTVSMINEKNTTDHSFDTDSSKTFVDLMMCDKNQFRCNDGHCLAFDLVCDGKENCVLGEDENKIVCEYRRSYSTPPLNIERSPFVVFAFFTFVILFALVIAYIFRNHCYMARPKISPQRSRTNEIGYVYRSDPPLEQLQPIENQIEQLHSDETISEYAYPQFDSPVLRPIIRSSQIPALPFSSPPLRHPHTIPYEELINDEKFKTSISTADVGSSYMKLKSSSHSVLNFAHTSIRTSSSIFLNSEKATKSMENVLEKISAVDYFVLSHPNLPSMIDGETSSLDSYDFRHYLLPSRPKSTVVSCV